MLPSSPLKEIVQGFYLNWFGHITYITLIWENNWITNVNYPPGTSFHNRWSCIIMTWHTHSSFRRWLLAGLWKNGKPSIVNELQMNNIVKNIFSMIQDYFNSLKESYGGWYYTNLTYLIAMKRLVVTNFNPTSKTIWAEIHRWCRWKRITYFSWPVIIQCWSCWCIYKISRYKSFIESTLWF